MSQTKNLEQHWTPAPHGWEPHTTPGAAKIFVSGHQKYLCVPKNIQFRGRKCEVRPLCVLWWSLKSAAGWWRCVLVVEEGSMHLGPVRLGSSRARHCPACRHCLARPQGGTNHSLCTQIRLSTVNISAANRLIGEVVQSRRRPLLGPSSGWKRLLLLSHLRHN